MPQDRVSKKVYIEINQRLERGDRLQLLHGIQPLEWRALEETILEHIEGCTQYVTDANVAKEHGVLAHYAGGLDALRLLIADLEDSRDDGGKTSVDDD